RADLLDRPDDSLGLAARGLSRLLAGRRPALGDGARDRLRGRGLDPVLRREPRGADLGRALPREARLLLADVRGARLLAPGADRDPARLAPGARGIQAPHAVPGDAPPDRAEDRRRTAVPGPDAALARAVLR